MKTKPKDCQITCIAPGYLNLEIWIMNIFQLAKPLLRTCLFALLLMTLTVSAFDSQSLCAAEKPNILLILSDDVGTEVLGCYGGQSYKTPHLDNLAKTGMRFEHCYSMPVCHPSRLCMLTGCYPFRWGKVSWGKFPKEAEQKTIAQALKQQGYHTAVAGKWQLTLLKKNLQHPHQLGFDEYSLFGWHEGARYYHPKIWQNGKLREDVANKYGPDVYADFIIDFMKKYQKEPFFIFYSMALCHDVTDDLKEPVPFGPQGRYDSYAEMVSAMDRQIGKVVGALDEMNLRKNTLILFVGDNGTPKGSYISIRNGKMIKEPVVSIRNNQSVPGGKGELTNAGTNVPLLANWKGTIPGGEVVSDLVDFSDFLPTSVSLAGGKPASAWQLDGSSFHTRLLGNQEVPRTWAYAESRNRFFVRTQDWKLYSDGKLFHIKQDPLERKAIKKETEESQSALKLLMPITTKLQHP